MTRLFDDDAAWAAFLPIARSWLGTPYRHQTMVRGRGADCSLWIGACWLEAGILTDVTFDYYPRDWFVHGQDERVLEALHRHFRDHAAPGLCIERLSPETEALRGDVLALSIHSRRGISNHAAMALGEGRVMHASPRRGIVEVSLGHWVRSHTTNIFAVVRI